MRIALVATGLDVGGAEKCLVSLACGLDRRRFEPTVYSLLPRPESPADALVCRLDDCGVPVHFLGVRHVWQFGTAVRKLRRHFAQTAPDFVQGFLFHANVVSSLAARKCGIQRVFTGLRVAEPQRWRWWALRWIDRHVSRHVCVSHAVQNVALSRTGWSRDRTVVIPNGVQVGTDSREPPVDLAQWGVPKGRQVITFVGRLHRQKGIDWLLRAMPGVLPELPSHDLLVLGTGPLLPRLKRLAQSLGIRDRVHFGGWCDDVAGALRASRLLVLPSRWEGMPNVLLEAMAAGRPVVATDVEGVAELLGQDAGDQVVPAGDARALSEKIIWLCTDPPVADRIGEANRQTARNSHSIELMIERYQDLYESFS